MAAAAEGAQRLLLLGTPERPLACLRVAGRRPLRVAVPLAARADRFAPCPGTEPEELVRALVRVSRTVPISLPLVESRFAERVAAAAPNAVVRRHSEFLTIRPQAWSDYYANRRPSLRKTLRHARSQLAALGPRAAIEQLAPGETARLLPELAALERSGHRPARLLGADDGRFVASVIEGLDGLGAVETHVARIGGSLVAYLIGFVSERRLLLYTMAFRADLKRLSLGSLLFASAIDGAFRQGREVDLGKGASYFKDRFAEATHPLWDVLVLPRGVAGVVRSALGVADAVRRLDRHRRRSTRWQ